MLQHHAARSARCVEHRVEQRVRAVPDRIAGREPRLVPGRRDRGSRLGVVQPGRVHRDRRDRARRRGSDACSWSAMSSAGGGAGDRDIPRPRSSRRDGRARARAAPSRGRAPASRRSTPDGRASPGPRRGAARRRAGGPPRPGARPRLRGSRRRPRRRRSPSLRSRSRSARWARRRMRSPRTRRAVELERHRHLPDRAVRPHREHDRRVDLEVRPAGAVEAVGRSSQVPKLDCVLVGQRPELGIVADHLVEPVLDRSPARMHDEERTPGGWEASALRRDADERDDRLVRHRRFDVTHDRHAVLGLPARSESRIATTSSRRYRSTPRMVLP